MKRTGGVQKNTTLWVKWLSAKNTAIFFRSAWETTCPTLVSRDLRLLLNGSYCSSWLNHYLWGLLFTLATRRKFNFEFRRRRNICSQLFKPEFGAVARENLLAALNFFGCLELNEATLKDLQELL